MAVRHRVHGELHPTTGVEFFLEAIYEVLVDIRDGRDPSKPVEPDLTSLDSEKPIEEVVAEPAPGPTQPIQKPKGRIKKRS